ncbi:MAG TPA: HAD family hydrolase [Verrucomicrobiae bacterium]|nr:HAD family hydrolase [Verrucomicrobiae bacterium]
MRWVSFDCFGTLVDWNTGFSIILSPLFGNQTADVMRAYHEFEREVEAESPHRVYKDVLVTALLRATTSIGLDCSRAEARRLPEAWPSQPLFADVEEMLASLRSLGCQLAVLINCDNDLFEQTQRYFRHPFDLVVTAEFVRAYKPSLAHFEAFLQNSGVAPSDWVHVACSLYHDIAPARVLGIKRVWLDRDGTGEDASIASGHVRSGAEVCEIVEKLYEADG